jgi:glyoxylase-like metal-dependent hydrolase (beta-lactamase superfamily II)
VAIEFRTEFDPAYGSVVEVLPGVRRVLAHNPSKYTAWGTGTYLVGRGQVAIIDPGPALDAHVDAVMAAVDGETVTHLLVTHTHADHSPAAAELQRRTGATTYGFGPHPPDAETEGEEHGDRTFDPDVRVVHGDVVSGADFEFECLHTPGHISNHVCFSERRRGLLFPGDHVMGWSTSVVSPPDGRIADYLTSLQLLLGRDERWYLPTHGPPIEQPQAYVRSLIEHRLERERQIVVLLSASPRTVDQLVEVMYAEVREELHAPAARSVGAHLVKLVEEGTVSGPAPEGTYRLTGR